MSFLRDVEGAVSRFLRRGEIEASAAHFAAATRADADAAQAYSDAGSFRAQLDRLFALASAQDHPAFEQMARAAVACSLTNRYYRAADLLSDVVEALATETFLAAGPNGEPGLPDTRPELRPSKLDRVRRAWLVPRKIAAVEESVAAHARLLGRSLPYAALARFERQAARLFALLEEAEVTATAQRVARFLEAWIADADLRARFGTPADGLQLVADALEGWLDPAEEEGFRTKSGWPVRLANLVPEERAILLDVAWRRIGTELPPPAPAPPPVVAAPAPKTRRKRPAPAPAELATPDGAGPLLLVLACPKCGGAFTADDETVSVECEYCSSLLILSAAERDEVYVDTDRVADGDDVLDILVMYRVEAHRAQLIGEHRQQQQDPNAMPTEWWLSARCEAYEQKLRASTRVRRAERVYAPYWQITGLVAQGSVGRRTHGAKVMRVRGFAVEHTVPAYGDRFNLRDRGLRLAHARVQPLTVERVREIGAFLPWSAVEERTYREVEKWRTQDLEPGYEPVARHGEILFARRVLAYRPYWFVELESSGETSWVMADGVFRTIAGYPTPEETSALLRSRVADPLRSGEPSFRRVLVVTSRCPDCGHDQSLDPRHHVVVCPNCHRALEATPSGIQLVDHDHVAADATAADGDYVPFWTFPFAIEIGETTVRDLPSLRAAILGARAPAGWQPLGDRLWIPGVRLLGSLAGDEAFQRLAEALHARRNDVTTGKIPLGFRTRTWGASISADEAAQLARVATIGLHAKPSAAQLNTLLFLRTMAKPRLTLGAPRLVMVAFERAGRELVLPGTAARLPLLLLEGGPELEAQRLSVHKIRANA